ncbi:hypothetical protein TorRG33x02_323600, partial [Trema orientale]
SLDVRRRHHGPEDGEIVVHLLPSVAFDDNVGHPLILNLFLVLDAFDTPSFPADGGGRRSLRRRKHAVGEWPSIGVEIIVSGEVFGGGKVGCILIG